MLVLDIISFNLIAIIKVNKMKNLILVSVLLICSGLITLTANSYYGDGLPSQKVQDDNNMAISAEFYGCAKLYGNADFSSDEDLAMTYSKHFNGLVVEKATIAKRTQLNMNNSVSTELRHFSSNFLTEHCSLLLVAGKAATIEYLRGE